MIDYDILKIKLLKITASIEQYTSDPGIKIVCEKLNMHLEKNTLSLNLLKYCCNEIHQWYIFKGPLIASSLFSVYKETLDASMKTLNSIIKDIDANEDEYKAFFYNATESKSDLSFNKTDIFIVHGHDAGLKNEVARFLETLDLNAIILHEQASSGDTIIEKIERYSNVGYGIVLYTPCDKGGLAEEGAELKFRARQNVVFEHGYLAGKLGRKNVSALVKGDIEKPNDISGVVYVPYDDNGAWKMQLSKELKDAGYTIDMNKLL